MKEVILMLFKILNELIETIKLVRAEKEDYLLIQNEKEAEDWLGFLKEYVDKEELISLENETADRFVFKFDVQISQSEIDKKGQDLWKNIY